MAAFPSGPVLGVAGRAGRVGERGDQAGDLGDAQRDHAGVGRRRLVRSDRRGCLSIGAPLEGCGDDGADGLWGARSLRVL